MEKTTQFPNFKEHLLMSWQRLKMAAKPLVLVSLIYILPMILIMGGFMAAIIGFGILKVTGLGGVSAIQADPTLLLSLFSAGNLMSFVLMFFVYIVVLALAMASYNASMIIAISSEKQLSTRETLRLGWQKKWPFFIGALTFAFLIFGSMGLFFLPALLVMFYLTFTYYALLETDSIKAAINKSAHLVSKNFGFVFGRMLGLFVLQIVLTGILPEIIAEISDTLSVIYAPVDFIISMGWGFLTMAYTFEMYKHLKQTTKQDKNYSPGWIWWVAIVGWLMFGLLMLGFSKLMKSGLGDYIKQQAQMELEQTQDFNQVGSGLDREALPSMEEYQQYLDEAGMEDMPSAEEYQQYLDYMDKMDQQNQFIQSPSPAVF